MKRKLYIKPNTAISDFELSHSILDPSQGIAPGGLAKDRDELEEEQLQQNAINQQMKSEYSLW